MVAVRTTGMAMQMVVVQAVEVALVQALRAAVVVPLMVVDAFAHGRVRDPFALASSKELARPQKADADDLHAIVGFVQLVNALRLIHVVHPLNLS